MAEDISNKTIVVLVILTVIISILGTVVVLNEVNHLKIEPARVEARTSSSSSGKVTFTIEERPEPVSSSGYVTFEILPK